MRLRSVKTFGSKNSMKIIQEIPLQAFHPWSGAKDTFEVLTDEELNELEMILEDIYPEGMTETQLNDILWFERDWIAEVLDSDFQCRFNI